MAFGFMNSRKGGQHFDLAMLAIKKLESANLALKGKKESEYEQVIISHLQSEHVIRDNLITQVGSDEVDKITQAKLFGFSHRPDGSIGIDGTAIEIKVISGSQATRDILGQAIAYRMQYRFVILVLADNTADRKLVNLVKDESSKEYKLLKDLASQMSIFSVVGPVERYKNIIFIDD